MSTQLLNPREILSYSMPYTNSISYKKTPLTIDDTIKKYPPFVEGEITATFGMRIHPVTNKEVMHYGIDIGTSWRCNIPSFLDGTILETGVHQGYGNYILIKHNESLYSFYAHLSKILVKEGDIIKKGETIGLEGGDPIYDENPGISTGHHLHFEIRTSIDPLSAVDPLLYLDY